MEEKKLSEVFTASAEVKALLDHVRKEHREYREYKDEFKGDDDDNALLFNSGFELVKICLRIVENQARQDKQIAEQAATIAKLEKRLAEVEKETFIRPLAGKIPMKP